MGQTRRQHLQSYSEFCVALLGSIALQLGFPLLWALTISGDWPKDWPPTSFWFIYPCFGFPLLFGALSGGTFLMRHPRNQPLAWGLFISVPLVCITVLYLFGLTVSRFHWPN